MSAVIELNAQRIADLLYGAWTALKLASVEKEDWERNRARLEELETNFSSVVGSSIHDRARNDKSFMHDLADRCLLRNQVIDAMEGRR